MTTTDIDALIRLVRQNTEARDALRRELLTDDLLSLPERFSQYTLSADRRLDTLLQHAEATNRTLEALLQHADAIGQQMRGIQHDLSEIHGITQRQQTDFSNFRGAYAENTARRKASLITRMVAMRLGKRVIASKQLTRDNLADMIIEAHESSDLSDISDDTLTSFQDSDIIIEAKERSRAGNIFYIAVEASYTGHEEDTDRAVEHAELLRRFTGQDAYPVVAGVRIGNDIVDVVNGHGQVFVPWYQLSEGDLDP